MSASPQALKLDSGKFTLRLRDVMQRLTQPAETFLEAESAPIASFGGLIDALTREIDETVLPRQLALFSGDKRVALMTLSNRRLLTLQIEGQEIATGGGKDMSPDLVANTMAQALKALCVRSAPLRIQMLGRATNALTGGEACSARHLAQFSETPCFKNRLKAFLKQIHPASQGWIYRTGDGEPVEHAPDSELFEHLKALEEKYHVEADARRGYRHLPKPSPQLAAFPVSATTQTIVVSDGCDLVIAALPNSEIPSAMAQWKMVYGRQKGREPV